MKQLYILLLFLILANTCFSQDASYNNLSISNLTKNDGAYGYFGWGNAPDNTKDPRPNIQPGQSTFMINNHTGLTLSAHSYYGGIRFYNQGYPNAYDPASGSVMVMSVNNGSVGIRTGDPQATLDVNGSIQGGSNGNKFLYNGAADVYLSYPGRGSGGRAVVHDAGNILTLNYGGDFSGGTKLGTQFYFSENASGTSYLNGGNVGIGTIDTKGYKFAVNGSIIATAVTVKNYVNWPDYVFKKKYSLMPLSKLKTFISNNHHLPEIPSAAQIEKEGLNLSEASARQLKKIEELTRYLIEKDEQLNQQNQRIKAQALRLKSLETTVKRLAENLH